MIFIHFLYWKLLNSVMRKSPLCENIWLLLENWFNVCLQEYIYLTFYVTLSATLHGPTMTCSSPRSYCKTQHQLCLINLWGLVLPSFHSSGTLERTYLSVKKWLKKSVFLYLASHFIHFLTPGYLLKEAEKSCFAT